MIDLLAQVYDQGIVLDWKHLVLALLIPAAGYVGAWIGKRGVRLLEDRLVSAGHPAAAQAFDLLVQAAAKAFTDEEKEALGQAAKDQGVDHPAINKVVNS